MNLRKNFNSKTGRTYLTIVRSYREKGRKNPTAVTVKSLGYLDELIKEYPDPIAHFKKVVEEMNKKEKEDTPPTTIKFDKKTLLDEKNEVRKNFGYAALSKIYHELDLHVFLSNHTRNLKIEYNTNNIIKNEIFSRILDPASKKKTFENKERFFEKNDFTIDDVYRCLTNINTLRDDILLHMHKKITQLYKRNSELAYYNVTNYYFEIDEQDSMRKKGVSKEQRPNPIIQMGLFMDSMGFPITYRLFDGNTNDCETLIPILRNMKLNCNIGRTIVVADKGMNISNNIIFNLINKDGYVYSQTVRGGHKELKEYVLDEKNYQWINKNYKIKSRIYPRIVYVNDINGKKKKIRIDEKQVVFYNRDYDKKAKADREAAIIKARDMANNPSKYNKQTSYGAAKYVKNITFDKETGEIVTIGNKPVFDEEKLQNEEKFDGYYAIVTSEYKKTDNEIIEIYRRLWKIEESFKVTKSDFKSRPVYVSREDHIQSHFLICFIALVIARLLEHRLDNIHSIKQIASSLNKVSCSPLEENWYIFDYKDDITEAISKKLGIDMNRKYLRLGDIKKILGNTKI